MKKIKENISAILLTLFALFILYNSSVTKEKVLHEMEECKLRLDSIIKINDSLSDELLPKQIEIGRYQLALEIFFERNPKAAEQYATIISEETE